MKEAALRVHATLSERTLEMVGLTPRIGRVTMKTSSSLLDIGMVPAALANLFGQPVTTSSAGGTAPRVEGGLSRLSSIPSQSKEVRGLKQTKPKTRWLHLAKKEETYEKHS